MKVEKTPFIYLNPDEISLIKNLSELPEHLENARDWLVISCLCGQRVSDFMRFKKLNRQKRNLWGRNNRLRFAFQQLEVFFVNRIVKRLELEYFQYHEFEFFFRIYWKYFFCVFHLNSRCEYKIQCSISTVYRISWDYPIPQSAFLPFQGSLLLAE